MNIRANFRTACRSSELRRDLIYHVDMARIRVTLWIGSVEPVDIGQQNQKRCMQHRSHLGGERVVVADLQLLNRDRIVLIDDRNRTAPEQDGEGAEDVFIAAAVLKVTAVQKESAHTESGTPSDFSCIPPSEGPGRQQRQPVYRQFSSAVF